MFCSFQGTYYKGFGWDMYTHGAVSLAFLNWVSVTVVSLV